MKQDINQLLTYHNERAHPNTFAQQAQSLLLPSAWQRDRHDSESGGQVLW